MSDGKYDGTESELTVSDDDFPEYAAAVRDAVARENMIEQVAEEASLHRRFEVKRNFNRELLQGLFKIRNRDPRVRPWIRQCIEIERRRGV